MTRRVKRCPACGREVRCAVRDCYRFEQSGLDNVYLENVETLSCACGTSVVLHGLRTLLRVISACFAYKPTRLRGAEVRFARHVLQKKGRDFASLLSISPEHLSRIENSAEPLDSRLDKLVRALIALYLIEPDPDGKGSRKLSRSFDRDAFKTLLEQRLPADERGMCLFLRYDGTRPAGGRRPLRFEFRAAA